MVRGEGGASAWPGVLSGLLLFLATSPLGLGFLAFPALAPLLHSAVTAATVRRAAWSGYACGLVFFGAGYLWIPWNLGGHVWAIWVVVIPLLAIPIGAFAAILSSLARVCGRGPALCLAPALWVSLEAVRALEPFGIGWLRLGHALAPWPIWIQLAAAGGVGLVSGWAVAVGAALAHAVATGRRTAWTLAATVPALGTLIGAGVLAEAEVRGEPALRIAAVQPAVSASDRFAAARFDANLGRLLSLSREAIASAAPDLIVWPEGAFESAAGPNGAPFVGAVASTLATPLLTGVRRVAGTDTDLRFNSAVLADPDGETRVVADKQRPVPLYERAADGWLAGALARATALPGRVLAGASAEPGSVRARDGTQHRVGVLICLDAAFPEIAREARRRGAELLVSVANEAESGRWSAYQHALLIRLRAVETGLPLVRVANGGPSVWIDPLGRELARIEPGPHARVAALGPPLAPPLYVSLGDAPIVAALFVPGLVISAVGVGLDARSRPRRLTERTFS
jgi:apolipoprotein N-acyltransferase